MFSDSTASKVQRPEWKANFCEPFHQAFQARSCAELSVSQQTKLLELRAMPKKDSKCASLQGCEHLATCEQMLVAQVQRLDLRKSNTRSLPWSGAQDLYCKPKLLC